MQDDLIGLARNGVLRVAINIGNGALVQERDGTFFGVSPALANRLARRIGATLRPVIYPGAGRVFEDADKDVWDVAFLAIDTKRSEKIAFTRAYVMTEATYAVRSTSGFQDVSAVDSVGTHILTSQGSAYDMHLTAHLKNATLERFGTPEQSFDAFQNGRCDAVAGVRASLMRFFETNSQVRILPGVITKVEQAMVLPDRRDPRIVALDAFVLQAIEDGFVAASLSDNPANKMAFGSA